MFSLIALYFTQRGQTAKPATPLVTTTPARAMNDHDAVPVARAA